MTGIPEGRRLLSGFSVLNKINDTAGVSVFIVVPGDEFHVSGVQGNTSSGIKDGRADISDEVRRYNFVFSVSQKFPSWVLQQLP